MGDEFRDLKFAEATRLDRSYKNLTVETDGLRQVASAFIGNVNRSIALIEAAALIAGYSGLVNYVVGSQAPQYSTDPRTGEALRGGLPMKTLHDLESHRQLCLDMGYAEIEFWGAGYPDATLGFEAILSAYLVSTWTSFETLAGDLWEAAVNDYPKLSLKCGALISPAKINQALHGDYSLAGSRIGSLIRSVDFYKFAGLSSIRHAYGQTFYEHAGKVQAILRDKAIDSLAAMRNVIVHRSGKADQDYLDDQRRGPLAPKLALGQDLRLDGLVVNGIVGPVLKCCTNLLGAVDRWIQDHKSLDGRKKET